MDKNYLRETAFMDKRYNSSTRAISVPDSEGKVVRANSKFLIKYRWAILRPAYDTIFGDNFRRAAVGDIKK